MGCGLVLGVQCGTVASVWVCVCASERASVRRVRPGRCTGGMTGCGWRWLAARPAGTQGSRVGARVECGLAIVAAVGLSALVWVQVPLGAEGGVGRWGDVWGGQRMLVGGAKRTAMSPGSWP